MPAGSRTPQLHQDQERRSLGLKAQPRGMHTPFQLKGSGCSSYLFSQPSSCVKVNQFPVTMATITNSVSAERQLSPQQETWSLIESGALKALATIRFSTEDRELYPPLCKQHIWQQVLVQAITQAAKLLKDFPSFKLMHGLVPYTPMDSFSFNVDAAYRSTQFSKDELTFLRKLRLEHFLCDVPWGVLHTVRAAEAINTLQESTLQVTLKGETLPLFSENWRELFLKIFRLTPKGEGEGEEWQLHDLFPSLKTMQKGQSTVKAGDCQVVGSKRPLRLLSSLFCLNTTSQYSVTIHFAGLVLAALNGQKVDWPKEFFDEFKAEMITLHRHQQEDKAKVVKTAIGPHLTLIIEEAELLGKQERKDAGFGTTAGLTMTERVPPPRKRKIGEASGTGKMEHITRVTPHHTQPVVQPNTSCGQGTQDTPIEGEPQKRKVIKSAEKWQLPDNTSTMINQICFTHRRLEQLLTTFTRKAGSEFIKTMDDEFQKLQQEATYHFNQSSREKESLTENEHAVEKGLLHIEVRRLTKELATLNEGYEHQIEVAFELQEQLTTAETMLASLTEAKNAQQKQCDQLNEELTQKHLKLEEVQAELVATQQKLATLQTDHDEQTTYLGAVKEALQQYQKASQEASPATPRSVDGMPQASGSNAQTTTSALYSMVEGVLNPTEFQQRSVTELEQELRYVRRERDELQMTLERIMETPVDPSEEALNPTDIPKSATLPRTIIYHQLITNIPPFTTIMQTYYALKGLNLLIGQVPLLKEGVILSKPQFEQIWANADATARDTLAFMWAKGEIKLPTGIMELVTGSPPFYIGRFVLRTLSLISHHHANYYNHTPVSRLPTLKAYPSNIYHQIREMTKAQHITFNQALKTLTTEDTSICYEAVQQFTWLRERHPHRLPGPYTISQIKEYVLRVIREKETTISTRRFGTTNSRTILHPDQ